MADELFDRNRILGEESIEFDKALRGYDTKQVDDYIKNLLISQQNATDMFDARFNDLKNDNEMLRFELTKTREKLENADAKLINFEDERQKLLKKLAEPAKQIKVVDNTALNELQEKYDSLFSKNRLLSEDNRMLSKENESLKRDIAHLTKKVDKNRTEIKNLKTDVEEGISDDSNKKFMEIIDIYKDAIDKAEDLIFRLQTELSLAHSKAEDVE